MAQQGSDAAPPGAEPIAQWVLDSLPDKTALIDETGEIFATNAAWRDDHGQPGAMATPTEGNFLTALRLAGLPWAHDALIGVEAVLDGSLENFEVDFEFTENHNGRSNLRSHAIHVVPLRRAAGGAVVSQIDMTWRKSLERELSHRATHDGLTNLPNRLLLKDRLAQALARASRTQSQIAVLFCDLDNFKDVNDTLGHAVGDQVLVTAAARIKSCARKPDWVTRFGGDEFVVVVEDVSAQGAAAATARAIQQSITEPMVIEGNELFFSISVGVAVTETGPDPNAHSVDDLIRDADTAMYRAKEAGRNRIEIFDSAMRERLTRRILLVNDLRQGLKSDELFLEFQPMLRLCATGASRIDEDPDTTGSGSAPQILGVEALVRWNHPVRGLIGPTEFIATAEEIGLIADISDWVIQRALEWLSQANPWLPADFCMSINLSPLQLSDPALPARVAARLAASDIAPNLICLEISEHGLMDSPEIAIDTLARLRRLGIRLAVDDFGSGHSSLACLNRFPVDILKIDQSFIAAIDSNPRAKSLIQGIVDLATALGMITIAEGIETPRQLACLQHAGATGYQGFLTARPMSPEAMTAYLQQHAPQTEVGG